MKRNLIEMRKDVAAKHGIDVVVVYLFYCLVFIVVFYVIIWNGSNALMIHKINCLVIITSNFTLHI